MDNQQAIEILKDFNSQVSEKADGTHQSTIGKMACDLAVMALEKQIQKKPVKDEYSHDCCPNCGWIVYKDEFGGRYLLHCENCGQAIDWDD